MMLLRIDRFLEVAGGDDDVAGSPKAGRLVALKRRPVPPR
jgi:hypothetical protein